MKNATAQAMKNARVLKLRVLEIIAECEPVTTEGLLNRLGGGGAGKLNDVLQFFTNEGFIRYLPVKGYVLRDKSITLFN